MTNKELSESAGKIVEFIVTNAKIGLEIGDKEAIDIVLGAYNQMQDDERSGIDYIFNIHNDNDLKYLVDNGMINAETIADIVNNSRDFVDGLFFFNGGALPVPNITATLTMWLEEITKFVILYVGRGKDTAYQAYYEHFFVDKVYQLDYFQNIF